MVDDNHDNAEIIRQYLEIAAIPITVAHSGDEALALFETVRPALVLLDVMMPGRDGWEVCRVMKQHPTLGRTVRVDHGDGARRVAGQARGAADSARTTTSRSRSTCRRSPTTVQRNLADAARRSVAERLRASAA